MGRIIKRKHIVGLLVALVVILSVVAYGLAQRRPPALDHTTACSLTVGSSVEVEGYFLPNNRFIPLAAPSIESDTCQNNTCFLSLFSQPRGAGNRLSLELPTTGQAEPFVGIHSELNLPLTIPIKNQPACLSLDTKFRVTGTLDKTAVHACLIRQVQAIEVVDNPSSSCGP
jgi:hypothetical protein